MPNSNNTTRQERQAETVKGILEMLKKDSVTVEDIMPFFNALKKVITDTREALKGENIARNADLDKKLAKGLTQIESALERHIKTIEKRDKSLLNETRSDNRTTLRLMEQGLEDIRSEIPEAYSDSELRAELQKLREDLPEIPESYDDTEIREEIEELEKEIEELKKRPMQQGGGVTNARITQAFKYILHTEEPVGDIDGVNLTYTLSQPIFAILSMSLNGETIAQLPNYTINGKTFTFSSPLPSAYSEKDWEVKYI